ncbi:QOR-like protein [Mya arenaria]|uniref:QOR-like protein n=1 Tax=Mya arenaria TaxID=6604 RepID=A0ABY7GDK9_MYAAR|nr:QOR-like protein [Mya arenaria]
MEKKCNRGNHCAGDPRFRVAQFGGPEVLKVDTNVPVPAPSDTQVLVEVKAAGVNPVDTYIRSGTYAIKPPLPFIPGSDVAGIVKDVGSKVTKFKILIFIHQNYLILPTLKPGERVFVSRKMYVADGYAEYSVAEETDTSTLGESLTFQQGAGVGIPYFTAFRALCYPGDKVYVIKNTSGGYAEFTIAEEALMGHLPATLTYPQGAGVGIPCYTAYRALCIKAREKLKAGNTVLVHGASGAVGLACVQIAVAKGLKVLGTAGTQEGMDMVSSQGAAAVFNHKEPDYTEKILAVGSRGNIEINPRLTMQKESTYTGMILMNASQGLEEGWLRPHVCKEYSFEEAPQAHIDVINNTGSLGKHSEAQWYLRCRLCSRANSLEDCTTFTECSEQETCYTDLVVTQDQRLVYDAGCRSKKVCGHENKRALTGEMVACSRCCTRGDYCNDGLCGLKKNTNIRMCMSCDGHEGRPAAKPYPEDCQRFRVCDYNEACFARTTSVAGNSAVEHYTSCLDLRVVSSI